MAGSGEKVHGYIAAWPMGSEKIAKSTTYVQMLKTLTFANNFIVKVFAEPMKNLDKHAYNQICDLPKKIEKMQTTGNYDLKKLNNELDALKVYKKWAKHVQNCEDFNKRVLAEITKREMQTEIITESVSRKI